MKAIDPPFRGVTDAQAFFETPGDSNPPGAQQNVRTTDPSSGRRRMAQRPGMLGILKLGTGFGQGLGTIARASGVASYAEGALSSVAGTTRPSSTLVGNTWGLRALTGGLFYDADNANGSPIAGLGTTQQTDMVAVHPSGAMAVYGYRYTQSGTAKLGLVFVRIADRAQLATASIVVGGGTGKVVNSMCFTDGALWLAFDHYEASNLVYSCGYIPVTASPNFTTAGFTLSVGSLYPQAHPLATNATGQAQCTPNGRGVAVAAWKDSGGTEYVYLAAWGRKPTTTRAITGGSGSIECSTGVSGIGETALTDRIVYFRAGVWKIQVPTNTAGGAAATWVRFGAQPAIGDIGQVDVGSPPGYTPIDHLSFRFSSQLGRRPRGALPVALAVDKRDGSVICSFSNQGWALINGSSSSPALVAQSAPSVGVTYTSLCKISAGGTLAWEVDNDTLFGGEAGGAIDGVATYYQCDAPNLNGSTFTQSDKDGPAIRAIAVDADGNVYCGGRIASNGYCLFKRSAVDGALLWRKKVDNGTPGTSGGGLPRDAVGVASDGSIIVGGHRNNVWRVYVDPESSQADVPYALCWKLAAADGNYTWIFDFGVAVNVIALAVSGGNVLFGTTHTP